MSSDEEDRSRELHGIQIEGPDSDADVNDNEDRDSHDDRSDHPREVLCLRVGVWMRKWHSSNSVQVSIVAMDKLLSQLNMFVQYLHAMNEYVGVSTNVIGQNSIDLFKIYQWMCVSPTL